MVGWVVTEGFGRTASLDQCLNYAVGGPWLCASGLQHQRYLEGYRRDPQRMHAGRIARQNDTQRLCAGIEADSMPADFSKSAVQDPEIEPPGQPVNYAPHISQDAMNLLHVPARQNVRQTGRRRHLFNVVLRRLPGIAN